MLWISLHQLTSDATNNVTLLDRTADEGRIHVGTVVEQDELGLQSIQGQRKQRVLVSVSPFR